MKVSVIGCGYLGAVHAVCMAELGHEVVGIDVDAARIEQLSRGEAPFFEKDFPGMLSRHVASGRLRFTTDYEQASDARVHFLCVGTPQSADSYAGDLSQLESSLDSLIPVLPTGAQEAPLVVGKSTVPVGTAGGVAERLSEKGALLVWNPEFLREGHAVQDTMSPDRIVYGLPADASDAEYSRALLDEVYDDLITVQQIPRLLTDYATSELVKVAANSFLATKISFINAMAELCDVTGANVTELAEAIGYDDRIGPKFLRAGVGFGGGCLPKDIRAFMARAGELGADQTLAFLREVDVINQRRRTHVIDLTIRELGGSVSGKKIAILGAAFKPETDDTRDSPALYVAQRLYGAGAHITVADPQAAQHVRRDHPHLDVAGSAQEAMAGAHATVLLTEWNEFTALDPTDLLEVPSRALMIDGRNVLDPAKWREAGWTYFSIGRP